MKVYRMKHIPTGLYYCRSKEVKYRYPSGEIHWVKTNLSNKGRLYPTKPSFKWIGNIFYNHLLPRVYDAHPWRKNAYSTFVESEWLIEEV